MSLQNISLAISQIERICIEIGGALENGEAGALISAGTTLRQAVLNFSGLMNKRKIAELSDENLRIRCENLSNNLAEKREILIRRLALVEVALKGLIPSSQSATYGTSAGPYAGIGKSAGTFKYFSA